MSYFLLEEDLESESKIFLGTIRMDETERRRMIRGEVHSIMDTALNIPVKYSPAVDRSDFLNCKLPLASNKLKGLLEQKAIARVYYREIILHHQYSGYLYFYMAPPLIDCFDYRNSEVINDPSRPCGIRINGGFCLRPGPVGNMDIFRVKGLSGRKILISKGLKEFFETKEIKGVKYIKTEDYRDL
jgi:hypothetical protein